MVNHVCGNEDALGIDLENVRLRTADFTAGSETPSIKKTALF